MWWTKTTRTYRHYGNNGNNGNGYGNIQKRGFTCCYLFPLPL